MVASCSVGTGRPRPTASGGGSVWRNGGEGDYITQKALSELIFPMLFAYTETRVPERSSQLTHLRHRGQGTLVVASLLCLWDPSWAVMS